uniref:Uncharacterized protein n=1 Tax=Meloidogyne javanica TaxID=6303 RepID=A0A915MTS6_MELJA
MLVFYLPAEANEKITLAISILLALVVFLLLVSKILPPTSDTIPLMAKYLLMIFVLNIITIIVTVIIINIYFRGPTTHKMPPWYFHHPNCSEFIEPLIYLQKQEKHKQRLRKRRMSQPVVTPAPFPSHRELGTEDSELLNEQVLKAMDAVDCITEHLRRENINKKIREEWRFVAMVDIFRGYNSLILPMRNSSQPLTVKMGLQLLLLINVDEKDQIMQSNVWLTLKWHDFQLKWNPVNYGGVKDLRVSLDKVWLPDIVLFNNADGNYEVSYMSNVVIQYNGDMLWVPPAIYKSSCIIVCHLIFGSWTYNEKEIKMDFDKSAGIDLLEYGESKIWDVVGAPATLVNQRSRIEYQLRLRRKALFYTVVLIIPTVLMAFLSMAVFFLPTDSGEKMTLTLTFVLNVITILVTVIIINIYFRSPITHQMPGWVRSVFLKFIPRLLCMRRPRRHPIVYRHAAGYGSKLARSGHTISINNGITGNSSARGLASAAAAILPGIGRFALTGPSRHHPHCIESNDQIEMSSREISGNWNNNREAREISSEAFPLSSDAIRAIKAIDY